MLTRIQIKNFKRLGEVDIELGPNVVFIGPNNSGKTTVLQALALWELGLRKWKERRKNKSAESRPGVTINRRDLIAVPIPNASLLWRDLHMREVSRANGKLQTANIRIDIVVEGEFDGRQWACGLEFDYANDESFYCRPLRLANTPKPSRMEIPDAALQTRIAFLPPMSGLASTEPKWEPGRVNVLLGEGQTAQVLRNLCYQIWEEGTGQGSKWGRLCSHIQGAFGVRLNPPQYLPERGEITMDYQEKDGGPTLDLSASGRGLQQTMLLLAHLYANPGRVLLLDEPDAHLEILRQREIYHTLTKVAEGQGSQVIAASHSEVVLNEAADKDIVIAFIGKPHRIDNRKSKPDQVLKALRSIGYDQYAQAEQKGWVLYLEGSTDLDVLRAFADKLGHPAKEVLQNVFVHYVANQPQKAREHFNGLREAYPDLVGVAIFDLLGNPKDKLQAGPLVELMWQRREIENYLCQESVLLAFAKSISPLAEAIMQQEITKIVEALETLGRPLPWAAGFKVTDDFLDRLFAVFYERLGEANLMRKTNYHLLAKYLTPDQIAPEVTEKLDRIVEIQHAAKPYTG